MVVNTSSQANNRYFRGKPNAASWNRTPPDRGVSFDDANTYAMRSVYFTVAPCKPDT